MEGVHMPDLELQQAYTFSLAYLVILIFIIACFIIHLWEKNHITIRIKSLFKREVFDIYEYGKTDKFAYVRRHKINKNVQFILWKKGEMNHTSDYWINLYSDKWDQFQKIKNHKR